MPDLKISDKIFTSRLFVGTGKFSSNEITAESIQASHSQLVTMAMRRVDNTNHAQDLLKYVIGQKYSILPNTSGARHAREAVFVAKMARETFETNWLKLEIHPDPKYLMPDAIETLLAAEELVKDGFIVLPYLQPSAKCRYDRQRVGATYLCL